MGYLWNSVVEKAKDVDAWRKMHMAMAEFIDAWRIIPRLLVAGYAYMTWKVVKWYMSIEPYVIDGCDVATLKDICISQAPTTQDAVLVTAIISVAAAVFGLYSNSGKTWNGFTNWNIENIVEKNRAISPPVEGGRRKTDPPSKEDNVKE